MKTLPLSKGFFTLVDDEDFEKLSKIKWFARKSTVGNYYAIGQFYEKKRLKTVQIARYILDVTDKNLFVDHINGDPMNNTRANLRVCTPQQNTMNKQRKKYSKCAYKGITHCGKRFQARIRVDGKNISLGYFDTQEKAALAYNEGAKKHFGEFASLNTFEPEMVPVYKDVDTTNYIGVIRNGYKWEAVFTKINGEHISIGLFETERQAARAYDAYVIEKYSAYMPLNFKT